jgi:hypothetical protein
MKPIILCVGEHGRAVVYGRVETDPEPGQPVTLHGARMVLYWSNECGGLFGLAAGGPKTSTRITRAVERTTATRWTEWLAVSEEAAAALDGWPHA